MQIFRPVWPVWFKGFGSNTTYIQPSYCGNLLTLKWAVFKFGFYLKTHCGQLWNKAAFHGCWETDILKCQSLHPWDENAPQASFSHKRTFSAKAKTIYVQKSTWKLHGFIIGLCPLAMQSTVHVTGNATALWCARWHTNAPVWIEGKTEGSSCMLSEGCVNREVMEREDAAWPCGNLVWLSE